MHIVVGLTSIYGSMINNDFMFMLAMFIPNVFD
jgi:hypothetical protein